MEICSENHHQNNFANQVVALDDDEEDLLEEIPEKYTSHSEIVSLIDDENKKDDSGLGTCETMEVLKENVINHSIEVINCESNDSVIDKNDDKGCEMPQLIPLIQNESKLPENVTVNTELPKLFPIPPVLLESKSNDEDTSASASASQSRRSSASSSFIDSLLNKLRRHNSESSGSDHLSPSKPQKSVAASDEDLLVEIETPVCYEKSSNPNMLPTPIVKNQRIASAFVNSDEEYERAIAKTKHKRASEHDDKSRMSAKSQPPRMNQPKLPKNIQTPRTLAEKRALVNSNLNFLMIEQESKIYKQIQRKISGKDVNHNLVNTIMHEDIPINYGPWKAVQWLRTKEGNYIHQYMNVDGQNFKLIGSIGDHKKKFLPSQSSKPFEKFQKTSLRSLRCCVGGKIKKKITDNLVRMESIRRFVLEESLDQFKKLESKNLFSQLGPRPLEKKIELINKNKKLLSADEDCAFLGNFAKFQMPDIKLQVRVEKKVPLNPVAKEYLNEILPYRDMNENWINFSLSTLKTNDDDLSTNNTFEFTIPYQDNKRNILVREVIKSKQNTEQLRILNSNDDDVDEMEWTFDKNANKDDPFEMDIVDMIKDLTNSVFINLNDDLFTREEDDDRSINISPIKAKEAINEIGTTKNDKSKKMLLELRRLNANVFKSEKSRVDDEEDIRRHATAHLAKDEKVMRPTVIVTDSDTVLLNNKEMETRRKKRLPKRYSDYLQTSQNEADKEYEYEPPKKHKPKELQDSVFKAKVPAQQQPQQQNELVFSHEDLRTVKRELHKWLHVNVEIRKLDHLENIQSWCMIHNLYKCGCKEVPMSEEKNVISQVKEVQELKANVSNVSSVNPNSSIVSVNLNRSAISIDANNSIASVDPNISAISVNSNSSAMCVDDDETSQRVIPVQIKPSKQMTREAVERMNSLNEPSDTPKMEIQNISELVNGGIGPIYINVYDTKVNRLNPIFRSILNRKNSLAYIDGIAYFVNTEIIDITKLKLDSLRDKLEHPVFIIQPKRSVQSSSSVACEDFAKLLRDRDPKLIMEIKNKILLKEVADIIEIILQNCRRKIEIQIGSEPSEHIKEQLSMITRDRSNSGSSNSSAHTSPLHFDGKELKKAPTPDKNKMTEFNQIFSLRMQRLCTIVKSNSLGLYPLSTNHNKFYVYRWDYLLKSFEENMINVWQAKLIAESGESYLMMAINDSFEKPEIECAESKNIKNIRSLSLSDNMTELAKMILLRVENEKTKYMTVLLYGCQGYFRLCGILNSKENYMNGSVVKPERSTHPRLTAKIQKIYNIWYGLQKARDRKSFDYSDENSSENKKSVVEDVQKLQKPIKETQELNDNAKKSQQSSYKWFLFNVSNDFSDIYVKQWNRYVPYKIIMDAIKKAKINKQALQLIPNGDLKWPKIYALASTPLKFKSHESATMTQNFLLFGPYLRSSNSNLLLMQNVGGKMHLRDDYEQKNKISRIQRTRCLWIYANSLKCIRDVSCEMINLAPNNDICDVVDCEMEDLEEITESQKKQTLKISSVFSGFQEVL